MKNVIFTTLMFISIALNASTFKSVQSGDWNITNTWNVESGGSWVTATSVPVAGDEVFIDSSNIVILTSNVKCRTISLHFYQDITRLVTGSFELELSEDLKYFIGSVDNPQLTGSFDPGSYSVPIISGTIRFKNSTNQTIMANGHMNAHRTSVGWTAIIDYGTATATIDERVKLGTLNIESGTLKTTSTANEIRLSNGPGSPNGGGLIVNYGATLQGGIFKKSSSNPMSYATINGIWNVIYNGSVLGAQTVTINGGINLDPGISYPTNGGLSGADTF